MKKYRFELSSTLCEQDFKNLQLFHMYYFKWNASYNSSKLRTLIDKAEVPCISTKTFDSNLKLINIGIRDIITGKRNSNPVYLPAIPDTLYSQFFYCRLCYCLLLEGNELKYQVEEQVLKKSREKIQTIVSADSLLRDCDWNTSNVSPHDYIFDIHKFNMPPFFAPLFVGIVGSVKKGKNSWLSFKKSVLYIAESFYLEEHHDINQFLPDDKEVRRSLYNYWIEAYYSDEAFNFVEELTKITQKYDDPIFSYNLRLLIGNLSELVFLTTSGRKSFCEYMHKILDQYLNTPLIDPHTGKLRNIDLFNEFEYARSTIQNLEKKSLCEYLAKGS